MAGRRFQALPQAHVRLLTGLRRDHRALPWRRPPGFSLAGLSRQAEQSRPPTLVGALRAQLDSQLTTRKSDSRFRMRCETSDMASWNRLKLVFR